MYTVHTAAHGNECINEQNEIKQKIKPTQSKESTDCEGRMNSWMEIHNYRINRKIVHAISNSRVCAVCMCVRVTTLMCLTPRSRAYWFIPFNTLVLLTIWLTVWRCFCLTVNVILLNANKCLPFFFRSSSAYAIFDTTLLRCAHWSMVTKMVIQIREHKMNELYVLRRHMEY